VSERNVLGSVWEGRVSKVWGALGWGPEAARFHDGVKDFVGEYSMFIIKVGTIQVLCIYILNFSMALRWGAFLVVVQYIHDVVDGAPRA
jgi:hypothetical protein